MNNNTGNIEVGLVEEVYADKENTDQPIKIRSAHQSPYIVSIGIIRNASPDGMADMQDSLAVLLDAD